MKNKKQFTFHSGKDFTTRTLDYPIDKIIITVKLEKERNEGKRDYETLKPCPEYLVLSISGSIWRKDIPTMTATGQIYRTIKQETKPLNNKLRFIMFLWNNYHLNDLQAGTKEQQHTIEIEEPLMLDELTYEDKIQVLKDYELYEDRGYKYGHGWLVKQLTPMYIKDIKNILNIKPEV